jgi:hypothetical protein
MPSSIVRPVFSEGQVLAAADLEAQTDYARIDSALHERTEHIWGIASGLTLALADPQQGTNQTPYGTPTIQPGVAIDPGGRRIVVAAERTITNGDFINAGVWSRGAPPDTKYPIFLVARDTPKTSGRAPGRCVTDAPSGAEEGFQIEIGFPGSERNVNAAKGPPSPVALPAPGGKVLLGFVTWGEKVTPTAEDAFTSAGSDARVRHVGVRASSVIPHDGVLSLITTESDPRFVLQLSQDDQGKAELRFGRQTGTAAISSLFVVDDKGDLTVAGKITSAIPQVPISMSGSITHGLKLPLPPSITEDMIVDGRITVQYLVSPRQQPQIKIFPSGPKLALPIPIECWVDADPKVRRVRCRCLWIATTGIGVMTDAGIADYMLVITPKEPT